MVTDIYDNVKRFSLALSFVLLSISGLQATINPASIDLEGSNLIGPKNLKRFKDPKYDWMQKDPKGSSTLSSQVLSSLKTVNPIPSSK